MSTDTVPLEAVAEFINGRAFKPSEWGESGTPIIRIQNLTGTNEVFNHYDGQIDERVRVRKGDILISWSASLGVYRWNGDDAALNQHIFKVRLNDGIDPDYFYYAATEAVQEMASRVHGSTMQHITKDRFESIHIPLPNMSEQKRIAGQLAQADRVLGTRRYALELSETFLPAAFLELFDSISTQGVPTIEELAANKPGAIRTGPFGSQLLHSEFTASGIAVLGIDNAVNNRFEWSERRFISPKKYQELGRYTVLPGDVIITIMGTCGRCAIVPDDIPTAINTKHLCCITLDRTQCDPVYLHGAFLYHPFVRRQLGVATKGAIMDGLNMGIIEGLRIPLPPLSAQQIFATLVARHERLRASQREALRQADHLFHTLLHQAFTTGS